MGCVAISSKQPSLTVLVEMRTCVLRRKPHPLKALISFDSLLPYSCHVFVNWIVCKNINAILELLGYSFELCGHRLRVGHEGLPVCHRHNGEVPSVCELVPPGLHLLGILAEKPMAWRQGGTAPSRHCAQELHVPGTLLSIQDEVAEQKRLLLLIIIILLVIICVSKMGEVLEGCAKYNTLILIFRIIVVEWIFFFFEARVTR